MQSLVAVLVCCMWMSCLCITDPPIVTWSEWSPSQNLSRPCSVSCGVGSQDRIFTRTCNNTRTGLFCPGNDFTLRYEICYRRACPVVTWSAWFPNQFITIPCSVSCGKGFQGRMYTRTCNSSQTGLTCVGNSDETRYESCDMGRCPVVTWSEWSPSQNLSRPCSVSCGVGSQERIFTRTCNNTQTWLFCPGNDYVLRYEICDMGFCQFGKIDQWGPWMPGKCSSDGYRNMTRIRQCGRPLSSFDCQEELEEERQEECDDAEYSPPNIYTIGVVAAGGGVCTGVACVAGGWHIVLYNRRRQREREEQEKKNEEDKKKNENMETNKDDIPDGPPLIRV